MKYKRLLIIIFSVACIVSVHLAIAQPVKIDIDAAKDGPIYGDLDGLLRVKAIEEKLHNMKIIEEHPRIFITSKDIERYRDRIRHYNSGFDEIKGLAEKGDIVNLAFVYLMLEKDNPSVADRCAKEVIKRLIEEDVSKQDKNNVNQYIAKMALAFDWAYNAMTDEEKKIIVEKLSRLSDIDRKAQDIRNGFKKNGETFHREEWIFESYVSWPEIALAHHNPNAEFVYKSRWNYDWYWGDAARMYAYAADGTPFEGYYYGADGADWFLALKSATGINLVDGEFGWCKNAAYQLLYRLDLEKGREIFHHGVSQGGGGCVSYRNGISAWKIIMFLGRTFVLASDDPYVRWIVNNEIKLSSWLMTMVARQEMDGLEGIAKILFLDPMVTEKDIRKTTYVDLPLAKFFPGGNEVYMRTGWGEKAACIGFRCSPAYTKNSHGDFDINTFLIYRDGVLSPDSGVYDVYSGQGNYFCYQKNTVAHNNILVINLMKPDEPRKLGGTPDPGGVDFIKTKSFGSPQKSPENNVFLHNPYANWADITAFKTTSYYDYAVGEAHNAYRDRLDKYYRTLVFIRKENKGYLIVYDQLQYKSSFLNIKNNLYQIKWLLHLVTEPQIKGELLKMEVPQHIEYYRGNFLKAKNAYNTSALYLKMLKPENSVIRKVGGEGYEFLVDGSKPRNYPINREEIERIESQMDGKWEEVGTWRVEIMPQDKKDSYDFINVFYIGDAEENFNSDIISLKEDNDTYKIEIKDDIVPSTVIFNKGEEPKGSIVIKDKNSNLLIEDKFPEIKASDR